MKTASFTLLVLAVACGVSCAPSETGKATRAAAPEPSEKAPAAPPPPAQEEPPAKVNALLDPGLAREKAPEKFRVRFETTKGLFLVEANREWAPRGTDRFYNLVKIGFFEDVPFFRVLKGFVVQFGINGDPAISARWQEAVIPDDPVKESNRRGTIVFATAGPNTRTTQLFINLVDNGGSLDSRGFAPFGQVVEGMSVVDSLYSGYGEGAPRGKGPSQELIRRNGNEYLRREFPRLDFIKSATTVE